MDGPRIIQLKNGTTLDINPGYGHVHSADLPRDTGIKGWTPVSFANDQTGERFRIDPRKTTIGEANNAYGYYGGGGY